MKRHTLILSAIFLIALLGIGFSVAEPISASPVVMLEDDSNIDAFSLNQVIGLDDDDDDEDETDDDDDDEDETDDEDDDEDETDDDDDDDDEYTKEQAEDKISEAEDKINEAEDKLAQAISAGSDTVVTSDEDDDDDEIDDDDDDDETDDDDDAIEEAQEEIEDAKEHLAEAKAALAEGDYEEAYEEAEEAIEEAEEAIEELNESETGDQDDMNEDETAEEDAAERNLYVTVLINGQDATGTSEANHMQVSGDVTLKVIIVNDGPAVNIEEIEIKTSTGEIQVSSFEISGATLSSGTSVEFTNTVDTGLLGTLAELFGNPLYESHIEIKIEGGWDYELVVYWQAV